MVKPKPNPLIDSPPHRPSQTHTHLTYSTHSSHPTYLTHIQLVICTRHNTCRECVCCMWVLCPRQDQEPLGTLPWVVQCCLFDCSYILQGLEWTECKFCSLDLVWDCYTPTCPALTKTTPPSSPHPHFCHTRTLTAYPHATQTVQTSESQQSPHPTPTTSDRPKTTT